MTMSWQGTDAVVESLRLSLVPRSPGVVTQTSKVESLSWMIMVLLVCSKSDLEFYASD